MLTEQELKMLDKLADCFNEFTQFEKQHPDDVRDFADGIHICQRIIMGRIAVRQHPLVFFNSNAKNKENESPA